MVPIYLRFRLQMQAGRFVHAAFHLDQCREIGERHAPRSLCIIQSYLLTMRALSPSVRLYGTEQLCRRRQQDQSCKVNRYSNGISKTFLTTRRPVPRLIQTRPDEAKPHRPNCTTFVSAHRQACETKTPSLRYGCADFATRCESGPHRLYLSES
jgi:hypothetical protein